MGVYIGTSELKNAYIGEYIQPKSYDFTTGDQGWSANGCSRDSRGFYRTSTWSDGRIKGPSEVFKANPKKVTIVFNKVNQSSGTAFSRDSMLQDWDYFLPLDYNQQQRLVAVRNGSTTTYNLSAIPSGIVTWEMNVNTATTPRTVTHKITGLSDVTETSGTLDYMRSATGNGPTIRIVNWSNGTGSMCIQSFAVE